MMQDAERLIVRLAKLEYRRWASWRESFLANLGYKMALSLEQYDEWMAWSQGQVEDVPLIQQTQYAKDAFHWLACIIEVLDLGDDVLGDNMGLGIEIQHNLWRRGFAEIDQQLMFEGDDHDWLVLDPKYLTALIKEQALDSRGLFWLPNAPMRQMKVYSAVDEVLGLVVEEMSGIQEKVLTGLTSPLG